MPNPKLSSEICLVRAKELKFNSFLRQGSLHHQEGFLWQIVVLGTCDSCARFYFLVEEIPLTSKELETLTFSI